MTDFPEYEIHEAANLFPMEEETLQELADDIKTNGQKVPIELYCGKIIDGRRRYAACRLAGLAPKTKIVTVEDPVSYVLSLNLHRRQLTPSQRAMIAARVREMYDRQAKERQVRKPSDSVQEKVPEQTKGQARDQAGKAVGVSGKMVDYATRVLANAEPEVVAAVDGGRMSVQTAALLAAETPEAQRQEATRPKRNRHYKSLSAPRGLAASECDAKKPVDEKALKNAKGIILSEDAINCLTRIPKNDPLRSHGLQSVMDWIKHNK